MRIQRLQLTHLRSISALSIDVSPEVNLIHGANGSGKTSVLEAIHLLSLGRSFRTHQARHVITEGQQDATSFAQLSDEEGTVVGGLGVARSIQGDLRARFQGKDIDLAGLASLLPVQVIDSEAFDLLDGSPAIRRQFVDWGGFHHSNRFISVWRGFQRSLKQRNSLLKYGRIDHTLLSLWNREFLSYSEQLTGLRQDYVEVLTPHFKAILNALVGELEIELKYYRGWDREKPLSDVLEEVVERDQRQGFTGFGPQRADLRFKASGRNASEHLSRGQKKLVVSALKLAQGQVYSQTTGKSCIYLIDDLPAELDAGHLGKFCAYLKASNSQCFITCVDPHLLRQLWGHSHSGRLFKLEHGKLTATEPFGDSE
ncbi:MAG TPA: DNA replication/repair protein RecF [Marinobacterium sp.]|nr:DNA replication/repair protein RecF [Marinobacterium sp.]